MFRTIVRANEKTDVEAAVAHLRDQCERAGLGQHDTAMVVTQMGELLNSLVDQGRKLALLRSQMNVTRELVAESYRVKLVFHVGDRRSWFERIIDAIGGR